MATIDARKSGTLKKAFAALGDTENLTDFLTSAERLTPKEKATIVDQAIVLIDQLFTHLPLKRARHAINPVQRLRLLRSRVDDLADRTFHSEMIDIFKRLRDAHTNYGLPSPFASRIAFLPFLLEDYFEGDERRFLVSRLLFGFSNQHFTEGVEVTHWNGTSIGRAVGLNADREEGSNEAARFSFGLAAMTVRSLGSSLPPDEETVVVGFKKGSQSHEIILPWRVWDRTGEPRPDLSGPQARLPHSEAVALSLCSRVIESHYARRRLFAPAVSEAERRVAKASRSIRKAKKDIGDTDLTRFKLTGVELGAESILPDVLQFSQFENFGKDFGYIRIRTFGHSPISDFVNEFLRILELMPGDGLILDVRGNGGGIILNGELLLQLFTPKEITPEPFHFINTPLTTKVCSPLEGQAPTDVKAHRAELAAKWGPSIRQSVETGAVFSKGLPLTPPALANRFGQQYHGPVLLITDAQCYSTTDIFAAGFQDHAIGEIIGVDGNTGAGGANVWTHSDHVVPFLPDDDSVERLPKDTTMRVAIRRTTRVGANAGQPLEDLGVKPDFLHRMTKADLLEGNIDLITFATERLNTKTVRQLDVKTGSIAGGELQVTATVRNFSRLDCYVDGRPTKTTNVINGENAFGVPLQGSAGPKEIRFEGFENGNLVAARKVQMP